MGGGQRCWQVGAGEGEGQPFNPVLLWAQKTFCQHATLEILKLSRLVTSKVIVTLPDLKKKGRSHLLKTSGGKLGKFEYEPVLGNIEN